MSSRPGGSRGRRRTLRLGTAALLLLLPFLRGHAAATTGLYHPEAGRPALRSYGPTEYGGQSQVFAMIQARDGLRYFGFFGGLVEFDGANWQALHVALGSFRGFAETPDGRIYYTATSDLGWLDRHPDGSLRLQSILALLPEEMGPPGPFAELAVHDGSLHLSTTKGVVRWNGTAFDRFWPFPGTTTARLTAADGRLWFRRMGATELHELRGDAWVKIVDDPALQGKPVHFVVPAADGGVVLGVETVGLRRAGADLRLTPWSTPAADILAKAQLYAGRALRDGSIAIGTFSDGAILISPDGTRARQITMRDGLPSNLVQGIGTDREGRLWLCTYHGIATLEWPPAYTLFDRRDSVDATMIRSMRRYDDRMILGGLGGVMTIEPAAADSVEPPRLMRLSALHAVNSDPVRHSTGLIHGGIGGLMTIRDGQPVNLLRVEDNLIFLEVSVHDPDRLMFAGQRGVGSAVHRDGAWKLEGYARGVEITSQVRQSRDGLLWARAVSGEGWRIEVDRLSDGTPDWEHARLEPFSRIPGWPAERSHDWALANSPDGLTVFTRDGILRYDPAAKQFVPDTRFDRRNTPAGALYTIHDGPDGIWGVIFPSGRLPGGRNAMGRFVNTPDGTARWIPLREDIPQTLGSLAAHEVVPDSAEPGIYWLRGLASVMRLELALLETPAPPTAPILRRLSRGDEALSLPGTGPAPKFDWSSRPLTLQFAAPFSDLTGSRFEHRLVGWDEAWSTAQAATAATFTGLPAGSYVFEVRERDAQDRTGPSLRVAFLILPPWWQTPWAWAGYASLVLLAFGGVYSWRVAALHRHRRELEALVDRRTAELRAEKERADLASRAKSTFLAHMSHELRTPLNGIIGYAQVLLKDAAVAGTQRERVNIVHASGLHLLRMINEVLDFSKIEAGKIERHDETFHLEQLMRELAVAHDTAAQARGLHFQLITPTSLPVHVNGDGQKIRQILDNLLSNAVKFTQQGRVTLLLEPADAATAGASPGRWRFAVTDTGVGMDAEDLARLFQPFEQARTGRPAEPGTGLGLAITQRLVRLLGGDLQVESVPGRGTTFSFTLALPAVTAPRTASRSPFPITGYRGPRRRILVVDDNAINRSLLRDLLEPLGFVVVEFSDAESLLAAGAGGVRADLAFLDVKLPGMDGLELARRLRAEPPTRALPIVFTSASVLTFDRGTAEAIGCPDFLPKPFAEPQLNELLTRLLDLQWERTGAPAATALPRAPLPRALLAELLTLADNGDIAALRAAISSALGKHPGDTTLLQIEAAAASYQLENVRQLLRAHTG